MILHFFYSATLCIEQDLDVMTRCTPNATEELANVNYNGIEASSTKQMEHRTHQPYVH